LAEITDELLETMIHSCRDPSEKQLLESSLEDPTPIEGWDVLDLLKKINSVQLGPQELVAQLSPLKPRLYSISSSPKAHPHQVHLTVGRVGWTFNNRIRKGVASTMFADRLTPGDEVRVFVHESHGFTVPSDPNAPIIMVGPGTGIAPFRAFLEERAATNSPGRNWLFFGDQKSSTDFLYREELEEMQARGLLTRLDLAFSRDQSEKVYVQNRMKEAGTELWGWLERGAHFFVCGDAKRMALDVDRALHEVIAEYGGKSPDEAAAYVQNLKNSGRYSRDVY